MARKPEIPKQRIKLEILNCGRDPIYFLCNYAKIVSPKYGEVNFKTYPFQDDLLRKFRDHRFNIILKPRQMGISTIVAGYIAWLMLFHKHKEVIVLATKQDKAQNILRKVRMILQRIPEWLKISKEKTDNRNTIELDNGSRLSAESTAGDAARSDSLSLLVIDECVVGSTFVTLRNKKTGEIKNISMKELYENAILSQIENFKQLEDWEVLTPNGFSDFKGIKKVKKSKKYVFQIQAFEKVITLETSEYHKLKMFDGFKEYAKRLKVGDILHSGQIIKNIEIVEKSEDFYDLIDVEKEHEYYTNEVVSSNCAHIQNVDEIWTSALPTISVGGSAILLSTPNGASGLFHRLYIESEDGLNNFVHTKLHWSEHPDRDQEWFENETKNMTKNEIKQEYLCDFLGSGATVLDSDDIEMFQNNIREPISKEGFERSYWIWKYYQPDKNYLISCDVARGDGKDFSSLIVFEVSNMEVVAEYKGKIAPELFVDFIERVAESYGNPMVVVENNNVGYTVASKLEEKNYKDLYYSKKGTHEYVTPLQALNDSSSIVGFTTSIKTRPLILERWKEIIRKKQIIYPSSRFVNEIKTFIWYNGKQEAEKDHNDDLIMACAIGCWARDVAVFYNSKDVDYKKALLSAISVSKKTLDTSLPSQYNIYNPYYDIKKSGMRIEKQIKVHKSKSLNFPIFIG